MHFHYILWSCYQQPLPSLSYYCLLSDLLALNQSSLHYHCNAITILPYHTITNTHYHFLVDGNLFRRKINNMITLRFKNVNCVAIPSNVKRNINISRTYTYTTVNGKLVEGRIYSDSKFSHFSQKQHSKIKELFCEKLF